GLMQIDQHAQSFTGDLAERTRYQLSAIALGRPENVAVNTVRMHSYHYVLLARHLAAYQRQMSLRARFTGILAGVSDGAKRTEFRFQKALRQAVDVALVL